MGKGLMVPKGIWRLKKLKEKHRNGTGKRVEILEEKVLVDMSGGWLGAAKNVRRGNVDLESGTTPLVGVRR